MNSNSETAEAIAGKGPSSKMKFEYLLDLNGIVISHRERKVFVLQWLMVRKLNAYYHPR